MLGRRQLVTVLPQVGFERDVSASLVGHTIAPVVAREVAEKVDEEIDLREQRATNRGTYSLADRSRRRKNEIESYQAGAKPTHRPKCTQAEQEARVPVHD